MIHNLRIELVCSSVSMDQTDEMFYNEKRKIYKYIWKMVSSNPSILVSCLYSMFVIIYGNILSCAFWLVFFLACSIKFMELFFQILVYRR